MPSTAVRELNENHSTFSLFKVFRNRKKDSEH